MPSLAQIQQDIQTLNPEALSLVSQFIQILKKGSQIPHHPQIPHSAAPSPTSGIADWSNFIGCVNTEADLSVNDNAYLTKEP